MSPAATTAPIGEVNLGRGSAWTRLGREHWPIVVVLVVAAILLFTNLRMDRLWADEGDTAVLARSILKFGVPTAWDGVTFTDSDCRRTRRRAAAGQARANLSCRRLTIRNTAAAGPKIAAMNCDVDSQPTTKPRSASPRKNSRMNRAVAYRNV